MRGRGSFITACVAVAGGLIAFLGLVPLYYHIHVAADPLAGLVEAADLVILADVTEVLKSSREPGTGGSLARLQVRETWKGPSHKLVEIPFDPWQMWPAPPRFAPGEVVVAFLTRSRGGWSIATGTSSGALRLRREEIGCLRERVRERVWAAAPERASGASFPERGGATAARI